MLIFWSIVIATALLVEFSTYALVSVWFSVGGISALILAVFDVPWYWQFLIFFVVSFAFLASLRPFVKKFIKTKTVPTNIDAEIGKKYKLTTNIVDGRGEIQIDDVPWTVVMADGEDQKGLKSGDTIEIVALEGNKYIVKGVK